MWVVRGTTFLYWENHFFIQSYQVSLAPSSLINPCWALTSFHLSHVFNSSLSKLALTAQIPQGSNQPAHRCRFALFLCPGNSPAYSLFLQCHPQLSRFIWNNRYWTCNLMFWLFLDVRGWDYRAPWLQCIESFKSCSSADVIVSVLIPSFTAASRCCVCIQRFRH